MATRERAVDRGTERGLRATRAIGADVRRARRSLGLSLASVAQVGGRSASSLSRIERGRVRNVPLLTLARLCEIVGLELSARAYPGGQPLRDARHAALLERLHVKVGSGLRWSLEVPLPGAGDQRAWDAMVSGRGWRYGIECETNPVDGQALIRRLSMKRRDGLVDGIILIVPDTRQARLFRREFAPLLATDFPIPAARAIRHLASGTDPGGSSIIVP